MFMGFSKYFSIHMCAMHVKMTLQILPSKKKKKNV